MNEKTQIITNDIIQSLDALYNLCSDMSERIGSAQNQNVDTGSEDMALLSDNLTRLQGEVSAFRKQLADIHQDWEQIKSQLLKRTEDTMKAFVQIKVETHKLLSLQEQFQQELHRLKSLKATHRHIFICRASRSMLYQASVVAVILSLLALNAWQFKRNRSISDNDLKYRYVKMKGEATPERLLEMEAIFGPNRDPEKIRQIREDVEEYEDAVRRQAALVEQARLKEQEARELDNKVKSIKDKSITDDNKK